MRLGLVGYGSDTGVGMELRDALVHLPAVSAFILKHPERPETKGLRFPPSTFFSKGWELLQEMETWIADVKPDTILTWEIPGDWRFPDLWKRKGIRWVCVIHYDWFMPEHKHDYEKARLISPNFQCQNGIKALYGLDSTLLPIPVDLDRLPFKERRFAHRFVTVYGQGGPHDRRSIREIVAAWRGITMAFPLTIRAQKKPVEFEGDLPNSIGIDLGNMETTAHLYEEQDVAVLPSKFEGVGISLIEAQALGLPVITTDMEPMRTLAPDLLVNASPFSLEFMIGHKVIAGFPSVLDLRRVVDDISGKDIRDLSHMARRRVENQYSWTVLKEQWLDQLEGVHSI